MSLNLNKTKIGRKIALFALICGALGAVGAFKPLTLGLYVLQTKAAVKPVSGDIVIVGIDASSIDKVGRWPWTRDKQAELIRQIDAYQPKAVYVDLGYQGRTNPAEDSALRRTFEEMKAPIKVIAIATGKENGAVQSTFSDAAAIGSTKSVTSFVPNLFGHIWELPVLIESEKGPLMSPAFSMAQLDDQKRNFFRVDYGYDPTTIPNVPAKSVLDHTAPDQELRGKTVIVGLTEIWHNDVHEMPGWGTRPGVEFQVMGAETLQAGMPRELGWLAFFLCACLIGALYLTKGGLRSSRLYTSVGILALLGSSTLLTTMHIGNDPLPALAFLIISSVYVSRQKAALVRAQRNVQTGFSDMTGYNVQEVVSNNLIIAASFSRAETQRGYVLVEDDVKIIREVGRRLSTVIDEQQLTHNEDHQFLWEMPIIPTNDLAAHLEGLKQLFVNPLVIDGRKIDIYIFFGVDRNVTSNVKRRTANALLASAEARNSQATFKIATSTSYESHLAAQFGDEFDIAATNGDIKIMLEAQPDLIGERVQSAEAVIRWTHPVYGQIATDKIFDLARNSGNLEKVSAFLCKNAIKYAGSLQEHGAEFVTSVKVSTEVLVGAHFQNAMLAAVKLAHCKTSSIVFEIVDIHEHQHNELAGRAIRDLQTHGFRIGVGNFGATNSDMDLLRIFKPEEIFLIKSFSAELLGSTSNQIFADGVLRIARATGVITTADGIDDRDVLAALQQRGCDRGKGKIISNPLEFNNFVQTYLQRDDKKVG